MVLETERLVLAPWHPADKNALRPIATHVEVMRYITGGRPWTDQEIASFIDRQIEAYRNRGFCRWKLIEKTTGKLAGLCGVGFWRDLPAPEIGWWLARDCWGRGFASEAAKAALRDGFERVGLERVVSIAMRENRASIRIMEKLGMAFETAFENEGVQLVRYATDRARCRV